MTPTLAALLARYESARRTCVAADTVLWRNHGKPDMADVMRCAESAKAALIGRLDRYRRVFRLRYGFSPAR